METRIVDMRPDSRKLLIRSEPASLWT